MNVEDIATVQPQIVSKEDEKIPSNNEILKVTNDDKEINPGNAINVSKGSSISRINLGNTDTQNLESFDDLRESINQTKIKKIHSIQIWVDRKAILGIQASYKTDVGYIHTCTAHISPVLKEKYQKEKWVVDDDDNIIRIKGVYDSDIGIMSLEFWTQKGISKKYGQQDVKGKDFSYEFRSGERPTYIFGSFVKRSSN